MIPVPEIEYARANARHWLELAIGELDFDDGQAHQAAAFCHRQLAICALLIDYDILGFNKHSAMAAHARLALLRRGNSGIPTSRSVLCTSRDIGFCDSLIAADFDTARTIAVLSSDEHDGEYEYEDDFLFLRFLQNIFVDSKDRKRLEQMLNRWAQVLDGEPSGYLSACRALLGEGAFADGIADLVSTRLAQLERYQASLSYDPQRFAAEGNMFIEGLAVIRIGGLQGLRIDREYPLLPQIALETVEDTPPIRQDEWRSLT